MATRAAVLVTCAVAAGLGCGDDPPAAPPAPAVAPAAPVGAEPLDRLMPEVPGAKPLGQRTRARQVIATWCIDEADAIDRVVAALRTAGWTEIETRGTAPRIGIAARRGDLRFSASASGPDERCAGTVVGATIVRIGAAAPR